MKRMIALLLLLCLGMSLLCGCGEDAPASDGTTAQTTTAQTTAAPETTAAPTEPRPQWVTKTVYLCVKTVKTNHDDGKRTGTEYEYDEYGRMIRSWMLSGAQRSGIYTEYTYDENGLLANEIVYDADGSVRADTDYTYDENGYLVNEKALWTYLNPAKEKEYVYEYADDYSSCTTKYYSDGELKSYTVTSYDADGNALCMDTYSASEKWTGSSEYIYNEQGQLLKEVHTDSKDLSVPVDFDTIYTYNEHGLMATENADYYYGYLREYTYEAFDILMPAGE